MVKKETKVAIKMCISQILIVLGCFLIFYFKSPVLQWVGIIFNAIGCGYGQVVLLKLMGYSFKI